MVYNPVYEDRYVPGCVGGKFFSFSSAMDYVDYKKAKRSLKESIKIKEVY